MPWRRRQEAKTLHGLHLPSIAHTSSHLRVVQVEQVLLGLGDGQRHLVCHGAHHREGVHPRTDAKQGQGTKADLERGKSSALYRPNASQSMRRLQWLARPSQIQGLPSKGALHASMQLHTDLDPGNKPMLAVSSASSSSTPSSQLQSVSPTSPRIPFPSCQCPLSCPSNCSLPMPLTSSACSPSHAPPACSPSHAPPACSPSHAHLTSSFSHAPHCVRHFPLPLAPPPLPLPVDVEAAGEVPGVGPEVQLVGRDGAHASTQHGLAAPMWPVQGKALVVGVRGGQLQPVQVPGGQSGAWKFNGAAAKQPGYPPHTLCFTFEKLHSQFLHTHAAPAKAQLQRPMP